ncbi:MAG: hypothetical protein HUU06_10290 [Planctomycetaceae bacterium]|nr:hypothetical protein [Planctomycetota bacterium]NUN53158.1 hypothetical protein [Planctomycetaceae bacterium]
MAAENAGAAARLLATVVADHEAAARRTRASIVVLLLLNLFVVGYMTWIRSSLRKLDARELTLIAGQQAEARLPDLERDLGDFLVESAPAVTDRGREILLAAPAAVREQMEVVLERRIREEIANLEQTFDAGFQAALEGRIADLRAAYPAGSDEARLHAFLDDVLSEYRIRMEAMIDSLYGSFRSEVQKLDAKFRRFQTARDLTEQEALQKEILEAWVVLVEKHRITEEE